MKTDGHIELLARSPDRIVFGAIDMRRIANGHRNRREDDALVTVADCAPDLPNRCIGRRQGNDALRNKPIARAAPLISEPVFIGLDARKLEFRIDNRAEILSRKTGQHRIENAPIDAALIHRSDAGHWTIGGIRNFVPPPRRLGSIGHERTYRGDSGEWDATAIDHPDVYSIRITLEMRNPIAPSAARETFEPELRVFEYVIDGADESRKVAHEERIFRFACSGLSTMPLERGRFSC